MVRRGSRLGKLLRGAAPILAMLLAVGDAAAQTPICADLQGQYVSLLQRDSEFRRGSGQGMLQMEQVSRDLANAQMAARRGNCNRFLFFGPRPSAECPAINVAIRRLQQQLAQMRNRNGGGGFFGRSTDTEQARLREWLSQYGCDVPSLGGGLRTICVRRCDGYYFPISFSTSRQQMQRDEAVCQSMYAEAGQAELFAHTFHDDIANAVSIRGERYGDNYWAFLFRDHFSPTCSSQLKVGIAALGIRYWTANPRRAERMGAVTGPIVAEARVPMPNLRPADLQQDPETIANRAGRLAVAPYVPEDQRIEVAVSAGGLRHVGDAYYVDLFDPSRPPVVEVTHRGPLGFDLIASAMAAEPDRTGAVAQRP